MSNIKQVAVLQEDGTYSTPSDIGVDLVNVDITDTTATAVADATGTTPANAEEAIEAMAGTLETKADASHKQDASSITSGTLSSDRLPTVPVSKGGTGATTLASGQAVIGNGTGAVTTRAITATPASDSTSLFTAGGAYTELAKKAPTSHASTATTYGASSGSNYGHTKLSDNYTSSAGAAASGIGASSAAVYNAYNELNSNIQEINQKITDFLGEGETTDMTTKEMIEELYNKLAKDAAEGLLVKTVSLSAGTNAVGSGNLAEFSKILSAGIASGSASWSGWINNGDYGLSASASCSYTETSVTCNVKYGGHGSAAASSISVHVVGYPA